MYPQNFFLRWAVALQRVHAGIVGPCYGGGGLQERRPGAVEQAVLQTQKDTLETQIEEVQPAHLKEMGAENSLHAWKCLLRKCHKYQEQIGQLKLRSPEKTLLCDAKLHETPSWT